MLSRLSKQDRLWLIILVMGTIVLTFIGEHISFTSDAMILGMPVGTAFLYLGVRLLWFLIIGILLLVFIK